MGTLEAKITDIYFENQKERKEMEGTLATHMFLRKDT